MVQLFLHLHQSFCQMESLQGQLEGNARVWIGMQTREFGFLFPKVRKEEEEETSEEKDIDTTRWDVRAYDSVFIT